jgi:hypothetical protein
MESRRLLLGLFLVSFCLPTVAVGDAPQPAPRRVLFIGNSLTFANDLPKLVEAVSRRGGEGAALVTTLLAAPDFALEDHYRQKGLLARLERERFDDVVLQQGPSSLPESRANLVEWSKRFAARIRVAGGRPALFTVWPATARSGDFPRVVTSYAEAARAVDGLLLPAGAAWQAAWRLEPSLGLYGSDGFHPSPLGSYLAALVIEAGLTERPPFDGAARFQAGATRIDVDAKLAATLARAASEALAAR